MSAEHSPSSRLSEVWLGSVGQLAVKMGIEPNEPN